MYYLVWLDVKTGAERSTLHNPSYYNLSLVQNYTGNTVKAKSKNDTKATLITARSISVYVQLSHVTQAVAVPVVLLLHHV